MLRFLLPKQEKFFLQFQEIANKLVTAAKEFNSLVNNLNHAEHHIHLIAEYEREADKIVQETFSQLHQTFITPFDRHDIHQLTSGLDDIIDLFNRTARRFSLYKITQSSPEICFLATKCITASELLAQSVNYLSSLKNADKILAACDNIRDIRSSAEQLLLKGSARLFDTETNLKKLMEIKEIHESLEEIFQSFQSTASIIKGIVLEYS